MKEFVPCRKCKDGYIRIILPNGQQALQLCSCLNDWRDVESLKVRAEKANIWHTSSFLQYDPIGSTVYAGEKSKLEVNKLSLFINQFDDAKYNSSIIYMHGQPGTQKTHLAQWIGLELLRKKKKVYYTTMQHLVSSLSSEFDNNPEKIAFKDKLMKVDCLIVDESFMKDKVTLYKSGYQLPFLESFIRERIDAYHKGIIFISNVHPDQIASQGFGEAIQDFIIRNTVPKKAVLEFNDVYHSIKASFDVETLFT
jgi:DNA replication protein DnaC